MVRFILFALAALAPACASNPYAGQPWGESDGPTRAMPPAANVMEAGTAPTPYDQAELEAALPDGAVRDYLVFKDEDYSQVQFTFWAPTEANGGFVILESEWYDHDGQTDSIDEEAFDWDDLRAEGSFPAEFLTIEDGRAITPTGVFDCWIYTYQETFLDDAGERVSFGEVVNYFAKDLPGPPVYAIYKDELGEVVFEMALYDYSPR